MATIPILILYIFFQRYFVEGIAASWRQGLTRSTSRRRRYRRAGDRRRRPGRAVGLLLQLVRGLVAANLVVGRRAAGSSSSGCSGRLCAALLALLLAFPTVGHLRTRRADSARRRPAYGDAARRLPRLRRSRPPPRPGVGRGSPRPRHERGRRPGARANRSAGSSACSRPGASSSSGAAPSSPGRSSSTRPRRLLAHGRSASARDVCCWPHPAGSRRPGHRHGLIAWSAPSCWRPS